MKGKTAIAAALFATAGLTHAQAAELLTSSVPDVSEESQAWNLSSAPEFIPASWLFDSQPETRSYAAARLTGRLGYPVNRVARADRAHVMFSKGQATVPPDAAGRIFRVLEGVGPYDQVVVTGYAGRDPEVSPADAMSLAERRANAVSEIIRERAVSVNIRSDATPYWAGNAEEGTRAEVFVIRSLAPYR